MRRGSTPTLKLKTGYNLTEWDYVVVTIKDKDKSIDFDNDRLIITKEIVLLTLTQEETFIFNHSVSIQIRAVNKDGTAITSEEAHLNFKRALKEGVIYA